MNYDGEFIRAFLDGLDLDKVSHGDFIEVDENTKLHVLIGNAGYKVQVEEQTEDGGWFPNVIGEAVVIGTGDFKEDLEYAIWHALRDADKTRKYGPLEFVTI